MAVQVRKLPQAEVRQSVQRVLGVDVDGQYGPDTGGAVRNWKFRTGYPPRALDAQLGVPGQRMLLGLDPTPPAFAKRAEERTSGAGALDAFIVGRSWLIPGPKYASASPLEGLFSGCCSNGREIPMCSSSPSMSTRPISPATSSAIPCGDRRCGRPSRVILVSPLR